MELKKNKDYKRKASAFSTAKSNSATPLYSAMPELIHVQFHITVMWLV